MTDDDRPATIEEIREAVPWLRWELWEDIATGYLPSKHDRHLMRYVVGLNLKSYLQEGIVGDPDLREMGEGIPGETLEKRLANLSDVIRDRAKDEADELRFQLETWESFLRRAPNDDSEGATHE